MRLIEDSFIDSDKEFHKIIYKTKPKEDFDWNRTNGLHEVVEKFDIRHVMIKAT